MDKQDIYIADNKIKATDFKVAGSYVDRDGERFYKIENYHLMPPFFMSIVSESDHWLFISSNGALSAGRKDPDHALFPYYNDDQITDSNEITGSKTIAYVHEQGKAFFWEPFSDRYAGLYRINRNLYKNVSGNKLIFEEVNHDLGLSFEYGWFTSDKYGFIKRSGLKNLRSADMRITILDGIQNILPPGVTRELQIEMSTLTNAYKKNELLGNSGIGVYYLSSVPTDKAEPSEGLLATTVWSSGLGNTLKLICSKQLNGFRTGKPVTQETDVRASRGAYFVNTELPLQAGAERRWYIVAETDQDSAGIVALQKALTQTSGMEHKLEQEIKACTENLVKIVAAADGLQSTTDELTTSRHFSNVLFNIMRGGIFTNNYLVEKQDLAAHIRQSNKKLFPIAEEFLKQFGNNCAYTEIIAKAGESGNPDLQRLCYEYLPLTFSRRHGDPSRPWNMFSIQTRNEDGSKRLYYQGNWRDIFQNWEALCVSFPEFTESIIAKFVNASTADGYNPYRITRAGIDWEVLDPSDPWSHIGYWGDHQLIYLLKLLELSHKYHPGRLHAFLTKEIFSYANIPYKIKPYNKLLEDPHNTIDFDDRLEHEIEKRVKHTGTDAKLVLNREQRVYHVNLAEKLLVSILAKLSNFIPEAGIWLNTQRPEWNDANNALVGYGVSMVTLYYLRRYLTFCRECLSQDPPGRVDLSEEVAVLLQAISRCLQEHGELTKGPVSAHDRKMMLDLLGGAGSEYRQTIYQHGFSGRKKSITPAELRDFFAAALRFVDHSIKANKRADNLYHSYNLMKVTDKNGISVRTLYEMLEGQVAVLSSGLLSPEEAVSLLDALRSSKLFREDQYSYILYPDRQLPRFMQKNNIPRDKVQGSKLLTALTADGNTKIIRRDINGDFHFNAAFRNASVLAQALRELAQTKYGTLVTQEEALVLDIYEQVFDHRSFTGRSGTFYGYEGLGCIYWHMVSKLVLAIQENYYRARHRGAPQEILSRLVEHYYAVRAGIGLNKPPELYGAFPTDPYSHTPGNAGAKQPGMTGQVKEDILSRWGELGLITSRGRITFVPRLLRGSEFLNRPKCFAYYDTHNTLHEIDLEKDCLGFTYCQVPVVYHRSQEEKIRVTLADGSERTVENLALDQETSSSIFTRDAKIKRLDVYLHPELS